MTRPEAVLFDCDGVVVDSEGPTFALFLHCLLYTSDAADE